MQMLPTIRRDRRRPCAGTDRRPESRPSPTRGEQLEEISMAVLRKSPRKRVARAASGLTRAEREVLTLSARYGLSNRQIADRLGIPADAVERRLEAALSKFERGLRCTQRRPWWRLS
jgi:RNA polymerase sigma factor (sigma-70 family)